MFKSNLLFFWNALKMYSVDGFILGIALIATLVWFINPMLNFSAISGVLMVYCSGAIIRLYMAHNYTEYLKKTLKDNHILFDSEITSKHN